MPWPVARRFVCHFSKMLGRMAGDGRGFHFFGNVVILAVAAMAGDGRQEA